MRLLTLLPLPSPRTAPAHRPHRAAALPPAPQAPATAAEDDAPRGCGWFDSSHDLQHGLQLTVHDASAELATLVPLGWWLEWELEAAAHPRR